MKSIKLALCQITPLCDKEANVQRAFKMVEEAARNGADLIALPEIFYYPFELSAIRKIAGNEDEILTRFKVLAQTHQVHLCTGSMAFTHADKRYNTSHLIGPQGEELLSFSKCHLFDADLDGMQVKESLVFSPGDHLTAAATALGKIGIIVCYDIRFPEMARHLALLGTELLLLPAVFNQVTGPAHWECFMRTRAVENQFFLAAIAQGRSDATKVGYKAYGHSMVVSPWGEVLAEAGEDETILYVDIDSSMIDTARKRLPLLQHRRDKLYTSFIR